jgi:hypothetical protein
MTRYVDSDDAVFIAEALRAQAKRESGKGGQASRIYGRGHHDDMRAMHLDKAKRLRELAALFEQAAEFVDE